VFENANLREVIFCIKFKHILNKAYTVELGYNVMKGNEYFVSL